MEERQVYISGKMVPESQARISIFDSAVMLGDTVTESTRTFGHVPFKLEEHIERLYKSFKVTRIDPQCTADTMLKITQDVLAANLGLMGPGDDCWIVHNVSRGLAIAGADPTVQLGSATVMIFTQAMNLLPWADYYTGGCHAVTPMSRAVPSQSLDARIKNRSRMAYTLAEMEAKLVDPLAQSVILDVHGNVAENKGGNIFLVSDGVLKTPTTANCLAGLSRQVALDLARDLGIPAVETILQPYDLATADEVFFTSTPYCIMPATRFNGMLVGDGTVGPITKRLLQAWSELVGLDIAGQAQAQRAAS
ncbi:aminotransferase class IV [Devosia rhodophyticola]|uniref:Probable branched-chain-amino-acid aminotransferase n=1 Tax=Devosia rhodophyticola TaxID=3026423 RepID=A0ABY7YXX8_9HYPH|nr:aminotransferase class IV [Devosia rhodophyticola]WDR06216.1 aminotransferase class IV [Devosia rhodophyticola]